LDRILDAIPEVSTGSGTPIEITFDDGNASDLTYRQPALTKRGLVASFSVCAGRTGYLDKKAVNEIVAAGMMIGGHGLSHIDWRNADRQTFAMSARCSVGISNSRNRAILSKPRS
jgi:hypothetical protein